MARNRIRRLNEESGKGHMNGCRARYNLRLLFGLLDLWDRNQAEGAVRLQPSRRPRPRSPDSCSNRVRVEWLATLVAVTRVLQPCADFAVAGHSSAAAAVAQMHLEVPQSSVVTVLAERPSSLASHAACVVCSNVAIPTSEVPEVIVPP